MSSGKRILALFDVDGTLTEPRKVGAAWKPVWRNLFDLQDALNTESRSKNAR